MHHPGNSRIAGGRQGGFGAIAAARVVSGAAPTLSHRSLALTPPTLPPLSRRTPPSRFMVPPPCDNASSRTASQTPRGTGNSGTQWLWSEKWGWDSPLLMRRPPSCPEARIPTCIRLLLMAWPLSCRPSTTSVSTRRCRPRYCQMPSMRTTNMSPGMRRATTRPHMQHGAGGAHAPRSACQMPTPSSTAPLRPSARPQPPSSRKQS